MAQSKKNKKGGMSAGKVVAIGAGVAALGAGAYYFLGPKGKEHQKKAKVWMAKMKKDVAGKMKAVKDMTESLYHKAVDAVAATYVKEYKEHSLEIKAFAEKLKREWKSVAKKVVKVAKKTTKKIVNSKTVKKSKKK